MSHAVDVAVHSDSLRDQSSPMSSDSFDPNAMPVTHLSSASCCAHAGDSCNRCVAWARVHPRIVWGIVLVVVVGGGLLVAVSLLPIDKWMHSSQDYIAANQAASIAVLFAAMFVGVMVFLPVSLIETAGSFFFGWKIGFPVTLGGYWLGSMVALLLGRQCCMDYVKSFILSVGPRGAVFERMIRTHPYKMSFFIRLSVLPITVKNYLLAALPASTTVYAVTSFIGHLPLAIVYAIIGASVSSIADIVSGKSPAATAGLVISIVFAIVLVVALWWYYKQMEAEMEEETRARAAVVDACVAGTSDSSDSSSSSSSVAAGGARSHVKPSSQWAAAAAAEEVQLSNLGTARSFHNFSGSFHNHSSALASASGAAFSSSSSDAYDSAASMI